MEIRDLAEWVQDLDEPSVAPLLTALRETLDSFVEIGLGYLSLNRPSGTLSGGEAQRTKMIRHLGSSLTDVTYVFDEPTIGLHPHDIERMNDLLLQLRDKGNTVLVVEHKPETIAIADHVVDLGPKAGSEGGEVMFEGTVEGLRESDTITGRHLDDRAAAQGRGARRRPASWRSAAPTPTTSRTSTSTSRSACWSSLTGVAGSGKSSLIRGSVEGRDGVVTVDQGAIRGSRRSNPATYTGPARPDPQGVREGQRRQAGAVQRQLRGRLPQLQRRRRHLHRPGDHGRRLHHLRGVRGQALRRVGAGVQVRRQGHQRGARDVGGRGRGVLRRGRRARRRPRTRSSSGSPTVGLGYLTIGQPLTTLSGGERQRLKLATHLAREGRRLRPRRADHRPPPRRRRAAARPARPARRLRQVGDRHRAPPGGHGARRLDHRPRPRRRPRRRPDRLRGHARRPRRRPLHAHRRAPRGRTSAA